MQKIKIAQRFHPFSHLPGSTAMIPGSSWAIEAFPTRVVLFLEEKRHVLDFEIRGPVAEFTLEQDLEHDEIVLFGKGVEGFYAFTFSHKGKELVMMLKRGKEIPLHLDGKKQRLLPKGEIRIRVDQAAYEVKSEERLFLGCNKQLNWDQVVLRQNLAEMLPPLFLLGQKTPSKGKKIGIGSSKKELEEFLLTKFDSLLMPKRRDTKYLGIQEKEISQDTPLEAILYELYEVIRALFMKKEGAKIRLFPNLPREFVSGRLLNFEVDGVLFDIEWTKGFLRKIVLTPRKTTKLDLLFPKEVKSFRIKRHIKERGLLQSTTEPLFLEEKRRYYLDKFLA